MSWKYWRYISEIQSIINNDVLLLYTTYTLYKVFLLCIYRTYKEVKNYSNYFPITSQGRIWLSIVIHFCNNININAKIISDRYKLIKNNIKKILVTLKRFIPHKIWWDDGGVFYFVSNKKGWNIVLVPTYTLRKWCDCIFSHMFIIIIIVSITFVCFFKEKIPII